MDKSPQNRREIGARLRQWGMQVYGSVGGLGQAISISNITQYLKGEKIPGPKVQDRLRSLGLSVEWLMTGKGKMFVEVDQEELSDDAQQEEVERHKLKRDIDAVPKEDLRKVRDIIRAFTTKQDTKNEEKSG